MHSELGQEDISAELKRNGVLQLSGGLEWRFLKYCATISARLSKTK